MSERDATKNPSRRYIDHWHIDRSINLGHILTTIAIIAGLFTWGSGIDKRVTVNALQISGLQKDNLRQDNSSIRNQQRMSHQLDLINEKLDKLVEKKYGH